MEPGDRKYMDTMNYPALLMRRVNDVHDALRDGRDGTVELQNLMSSLTQKIYKNISGEITTVTNRLLKDIEDTKKSKLSGTWSNRHKIEVIEARCKKLNAEATTKIVNIIVNRLDDPDVNLLIPKERDVPTGGEFVEPS